MNEVLFLKSEVIPYRMMKAIKRDYICNFIRKIK
jgi:hypothetical protein